MAETMALIVANGKEKRVANRAGDNASNIIDVTPVGKSSNEGGAKESPISAMAEFISGFAASMNSIVDSLNMQNQSLTQIKNILREQLKFDQDQARAEAEANLASSLDLQGADAPPSSESKRMTKALPDLNMGTAFWSALLLGLGGLALNFVSALSEWWRTFKVMPFLTKLIGKPILGLITMVAAPFVKLMETIKKSTKFQNAALRIKDAIAALQSFLRALIPDKLVETLKNLKGRAAATLAPKIAKMMEFFEAIGNKLSSIKGLAGTGFIKKIFSKLPFINVLFAAFEAITGFIEGFKEGGVLEGIQQGLKNLIRFFVDDVLGLVQTVAVWITDKLGFTDLSETIANWELPKFSEMFETITDAIGGLLGFAETDEEKKVAEEAQNKIKGFFSDMWDRLVSMMNPVNWLDSWWNDDGTVDAAKPATRDPGTSKLRSTSPTGANPRGTGGHKARMGREAVANAKKELDENQVITARNKRSILQGLNEKRKELQTKHAMATGTEVAQPNMPDLQPTAAGAGTVSNTGQ